MNRWKHFTRDEFDCRHCGENHMQDDFIDKLDRLRGACGFPLIVTSGYRCPEHNQRVSTTGADGPHTTGRATDFGISHERALTLLRHALMMDFSGFGINQRGSGRFIHLDDLGHTPRPHIWTY